MRLLLLFLFFFWYSDLLIDFNLIFLVESEFPFQVSILQMLLFNGTLIQVVKTFLQIRSLIWFVDIILRKIPMLTVPILNVLYANKVDSLSSVWVFTTIYFHAFFNTEVQNKKWSLCSFNSTWFLWIKLFREIFGKYKSRDLKKKQYWYLIIHIATLVCQFFSQIISNSISLCSGKKKKRSDKENLIRYNFQQSSWFTKIWNIHLTVRYAWKR